MVANNEGMNTKMDVVIFPNAKNVGVIPPVNMYTSEHIQISKKDMSDILKYHKKEKLDSIIFRYGDPMDNGVEFYLQLIDLLDKDHRYEKTRIIIETPLITFLKKYGEWRKVVENDRILIKATFSFGEKESNGKFFSNSNLMDAYSRFWNSYRYRPVLIYYKLDENDKYSSHMESLASILKTTLEVRPVWGMVKTWATESYFYTNDSCRYVSSLVWFEEDPSKYEITSDKEKRDIRDKREEVAAKIRKRQLKAEQQAELRRKEDEREKAVFKALKMSKDMEEAKKKNPPIKVIRQKSPIIQPKPKPAPKKRRTVKTNQGLDDNQKKRLKELRDKAIEKINHKVEEEPKKPVDLYDAISRFRAQNHLG